MVVKTLSYVSLQCLGKYSSYPIITVTLYDSRLQLATCTRAVCHAIIQVRYRRLTTT